MAIKVFLDTNFLMISSQFGVDVFDELERALNQKIEPIIIPHVYRELKKLAESKSTKIRKYATLALKLAKEKCCFLGVKSNKETADDVLIEIAKQIGGIVATTDKKLRKRLIKEGIPHAFLRESKYVVVSGFIP